MENALCLCSKLRHISIYISIYISIFTIYKNAYLPSTKRISHYVYLDCHRNISLHTRVYLTDASSRR
jgi:hypothetical protein